jgi:DNA-binding beta-propeller fold protein YncE
MNHLLKRYRFLLIAGLFLFSANTVQSQDTTYVDVLDFSETNTVSWVNQVPTLKQDVKRSKKGWFKRLLLGKNDLTSLQKPVNVIGMNLENCIIFDQGNGTLFFTEDNKLEVPRFLRKKETYFPSLVGACMLPGNKVLFTDSKLNKIFVLSEDKKQVVEFKTDLALSQPTGIAFNNKNNQLWVVETGAHQITIYNLNGKQIKTLGKRGLGEAEFNFPTSLWIDNNGIAYVVDALNFRIQIFDVDGNFISMFGENGNGTGFLASPKGIATDSHGNIYIVDALFHGVQIFDAKGNYLYQFGTQGRDPKEFWMPSGIYIDAADHIYIADSYNARIQIFKLNYTE